MRNIRDGVFGLIRRPWQQSLDFCFPRDCPLCGDRCEQLFPSEVSGNSTYCVTCQSEVAPTIEHACRLCGAEAGPFTNTIDGCIHCRRKRLAFDSVVCLGMYRGRLKQAMLSAKWSYSSVSMLSLAELLWEQQAESFRELRIDRILPMPQHWQQRIVRHFNPAWIVAELLSRRLGVCCDPHILRRARRTRPQKRVSVNQRFANQKDAFCLRDVHLLQDQRILIVDDVLTTGATCSEAARMLKSQGAAACHVGVIGRVLDHSA